VTFFSLISVYSKKNRPMGSDGELGLYEKGGVSGRTNNPNGYLYTAAKMFKLQ